MMNSSNRHFTGILLAGGVSRRMGQEKGLLRLGSRHLYTYPLRVLEAYCEEILISTCRESVLPEEYPAVCDQIPGIGPMGGIYTCLNRSSNEVNVVLSYDLPFVTLELIEYMTAQMEGYDMVVPFLSKDRPEPLCAIYRKNCSHIFKELIHKGEYAVHKAFEFSNTRFVHIGPQLSFFRPDLFFNINREEDLERLQGDLPREEHEG